MQKNQNSKYKILILGCNGLIGNTFFRYFSSKLNYKVYGTVRKKKSIQLFKKNLQRNIIKFNSYKNNLKLKKLLCYRHYDVVINCIGVTKRKKHMSIETIFINSVLPYNILYLKKIQTKLVQLSTDCVFSGFKGNYVENYIADAKDLYGITKVLGEVQSKNSISIRTAVIGHEISSPKVGLMEWFLTKRKICGFNKAYFSGLTVLQLAKILEKTNFFYNLNGIYHLSSKKISKYDLLNKIKKIYKKKIIITKSNQFKIDRSLNSNKIKKKFKINIPSWKQMIEETFNFEKNEKEYN